MLLPWLVLIAAAVTIKANHNYRTLALLIPLALVNLLYVPLRNALNMTSSDVVQFDWLFQSLATGVTLLWLIAPSLECRPAAARIAAGIGFMVASAYVGMLSYGAASQQEAILFLALISSLGIVIVLAPAIAARLCRQSYRPKTFLLWLALWTIVATVIAILVTVIVAIAFLPGPSASELPRILLMTLLSGAFFGLCLYVLCLPYMVLGIAHPFFRARLQACLNLRENARDASRQS